MKLELNDDLFNEINEYCKLNNIENVDKFTHKLIKTGFNIEKYGTTPIIPISPPISLPIIEDDEDEVEDVPLVEDIKPIPVMNNEITNEKIDLYGE